MKHNILINLDNLETVNKLVNTCNKYKDDMYLDIYYGRYIVDGCSLLAVVSLMGNIVKIKPNTDDENILNDFIKDIEAIGGWVSK